MQTNFKAVIEDSSRNKYLFYYSGSSVCCKEVSKDGISRDTIIASQVSDNFLASIDLQDNIYIACINYEKGLLLFTYLKGEWKLEQILNMQGSGSIQLLSLFLHNGSIHIIYAKQMAVANFYSVNHLYKPSSPNTYHLNTTWRKSNVGEIYAENLDTSYSAALTKDGIIHLVHEWYNGSSFLINYCWYDNISDGWKKKPITTLFKKDIVVNILYEEGLLHLLCYTYEDEISAIFYYNKKEGMGKDFEFACLDKIKTDQAVTPYFHVESGAVYASWTIDNKFSQYTLNKDQKKWTIKQDGSNSDKDLQLIEFIRNRRGKYLIAKKTYFIIDYKNNIHLPYLTEPGANASESDSIKPPRSADGDLIRYIPYILDELKSMSGKLKDLTERIDAMENKKKPALEYRPAPSQSDNFQEPRPRNNENIRLKKSNFKDQFMSSNKLLNRPEASALYVGSSSLPNPDELTKKEGIDIVENNLASIQEKPAKSAEEKHPPTSVPEQNHIKLDADAMPKDSNLFKKIGDFFK